MLVATGFQNIIDQVNLRVAIGRIATEIYASDLL